ncbi:uncharacterized protein [Physcomitrium patens]|uniref:uncharacterized protein isoform X2 n=1 Tax=Physcomitrium patens TaxID=3218 RepID=UPI000D174DB3|nr:uncharacterized protein LOC112281086 isoform X2 [Physcomitrium patens]|eukprot:XP_024373029.1 uncharacterized protein LOC112281086 isoform X2 [Physcomitrella patens]
MTDVPQMGQQAETCRICLESSTIANSSTGSISRFTDVEDEDRLISPCACSGTQAYVHYRCLQRWQQSVLASRRTGPGLQSPALICSVCTHKYSIAPPQPTMISRIRKICTSYACEVTGLLIILNAASAQKLNTSSCILISSLSVILGAVFFCCFQLACYVALAGHNLQSLIDDFESGLALAIEVLPCSLQMKVLEDSCNSRTCKRGGESSAAIGGVTVPKLKKTNPRSGPCSTFKLGSRWWNSSNSLHPGTLLVATPTMLSPYYFGTVVLLYEHERCRGSRGIILNKQAEAEILKWENQLFLGVHNSAALRHITHGTGGSHKPDDWFILQRCSPSPVKCKHCAADTARPKTCSKDWGREILPGIFLGKDVGPVLRHLNGCKRLSVMGQQCSVKAESIKEDRVRKNEECYYVDHQVIHGHAEWYVGQLGSAVKRGLWKTRENASAILLSTPPHELWHTLLSE